MRRFLPIFFGAIRFDRFLIKAHRIDGLSQLAIDVGDIVEHRTADIPAAALHLQTAGQLAQSAAKIAEPAQRSAYVFQIAGDGGAVLARGRKLQRALETLQGFGDTLAPIIENAAAAYQFIVRIRVAMLAKHGLRAVQRMLGLVETPGRDTVFRMRKQSRCVRFAVDSGCWRIDICATQANRRVGQGARRRFDARARRRRRRLGTQR